MSDNVFRDLILNFLYKNCLNFIKCILLKSKKASKMLFQFILIKLLVLQCLFYKISSTTLQKRQSTNTIPVCVGGFVVQENGVTVCNKDASGALRYSHEVF
jgi:hypothetical protein